MTAHQFLSYVRSPEQGAEREAGQGQGEPVGEPDVGEAPSIGESPSVGQAGAHIEGAEREEHTAVLPPDAVAQVRSGPPPSGPAPEAGPAPQAPAGSGRACGHRVGRGTPRPARPSAQAGRDSTWLVSRRLPRGPARTATWAGDGKQHPIRSAPPRWNRRHGPHAQRRSHPSWRHGPLSAARRAGWTSAPRPSRRPRPGRATASRASRRPRRACPAAITAGIPTVFRPRVGRAGP